jgi:hypothetical protein
VSLPPPTFLIQVILRALNIPLRHGRYPTYQLVSAHLMPFPHKNVNAKLTHRTPFHHPRLNTPLILISLLQSLPETSLARHISPLISPTKRKSLSHLSSSLYLHGFAKSGCLCIIYAEGPTRGERWQWWSSPGGLS